ncbi:TetR/AcrR family transcriptional regulator [Novosphingobium album (ex Liu et al. 2023)]|uniref:TetR/AcrR family transcriptional regulator n=1 Tax=Novosphingobium album (ex Liu et al. 2023) TaxID=3031130 RepID=A0ABT5WUN4_9SPHN|nr:TetR/AcrR family transcriptional regulator [Novosphingobium album (ex Liu et al. 2023)]MDE8653615.1 TetR/AcrR family transcriptional regulator [Novosphingobium album (ex Liu et al. 2023)]
MAERGSKARAGRNARSGNVAGADRRDLILAAASRRFAEFGFGATTVRQIADDVHVLSGSLYHHFATKEEILDEIVREAALEQRDRSLRIAALAAGAEQKLVTLVQEDLRALTRRLEAYTIIFNERKFFRRSADFAYLMQARKAAYDAWVAILEEGIAEGVFRPDIDRYLTISTIMRMLTNGADWFMHEDGSPIDAMAHYSLDALCDFYVGFVLRSIRAAGRGDEAIPRPLVLD